jgi:hypothetical protein
MTNNFKANIHLKTPMPKESTEAEKGAHLLKSNILTNSRTIIILENRTNITGKSSHTGEERGPLKASLLSPSSNNNITTTRGNNKLTTNSSNHSILLKITNLSSSQLNKRWIPDTPKYPLNSSRIITQSNRILTDTHSSHLLRINITKDNSLLLLLSKNNTRKDHLKTNNNNPTTKEAVRSRSNTNNHPPRSSLEEDRSLISNNPRNNRFTLNSSNSSNRSKARPTLLNSKPDLSSSKIIPNREAMSRTNLLSKYIYLNHFIGHSLLVQSTRRLKKKSILLKPQLMPLKESSTLITTELCGK